MSDDEDDYDEKIEEKSPKQVKSCLANLKKTKQAFDATESEEDFQTFPDNGDFSDKPVKKMLIKEAKQVNYFSLLCYNFYFKGCISVDRKASKV